MVLKNEEFEKGFIVGGFVMTIISVAIIFFNYILGGI